MGFHTTIRLTKLPHGSSAREAQLLPKTGPFRMDMDVPQPEETKEEEDDVNVHDLVLLQPFLPEEMAEKRYVTEEEEDEDEDEDEG